VSDVPVLLGRTSCTGSSFLLSRYRPLMLYRRVSARAERYLRHSGNDIEGPVMVSAASGVPARCSASAIVAC